ncbi:MAG: hypothetical protein CL933_17860 [Deltaproteobacteria bacterium]|nr:hypothetical protein [Deltaproteobacteria bacterium]
MRLRNHHDDRVALVLVAGGNRELSSRSPAGSGNDHQRSRRRPVQAGSQQAHDQAVQGFDEVIQEDHADFGAMNGVEASAKARSKPSEGLV